MLCTVCHSARNQYSEKKQSDQSGQCLPFHQQHRMTLLVRLKISPDLSEFVLLSPDALRRMGIFFKRSNCAIINFASLSSEGKLLKERICSSRSKFFPLRADPYFKIFLYPEKHIESRICCSPLYKWRNNMDLYNNPQIPKYLVSDSLSQVLTHCWIIQTTCLHFKITTINGQNI